MIRIGGIASGLDTQQLITDLMRAERMPMNRVFQQKEWLEWQRDAYRDVNLAVTKFRTDFQKLSLSSTFRSTTGTSSDPSIAAVKTGTNAIPGSYVVKVDEMPKAASIISQTVTDAEGKKVQSSDNIFKSIGRESDDGDFSFTIKVDGDKEATLTISSTDTFGSLATKISNLALEDGSSAGLRASFDNTTGTLMITSREMGENKRIEIERPTGDAHAEALYQNLFGSETASVKGQNGSVQVGDFVINDLTSNKLTVHGIELTLYQTGTTTVTVGTDPDELFNTIVAFVDSYNTLIADLQGKVNERRNRDYPPLTTEERAAISEKEAELWDEKAKQGLLANDPIVQGLLNEMRVLLSKPVEGIPDGQINALHQIGITTSSDWHAGGMLVINEDKLREAIANKPDEVQQLFTKRADSPGDKDSAGLGDRLFAVSGALNNSINSLARKAGSPGNNSDTQSVLARDLKQVNDQLANWERRLIQIEDRYWRQFTAMEKALQRMNDQSAWIMNNMFGMSG